MKKVRPSKTMVTMVDHGHCFIWVSELYIGWAFILKGQILLLVHVYSELLIWK